MSGEDQPKSSGWSAARVALLLTSFVLTFAMLECGVRAVRGELFSTEHQIVDRRSRWKSSLYTHDRALGWVPRPGAAMRGVDLDWKKREAKIPGTHRDATVTILASGARSNGTADDAWRSKLPTKPLILVVGDSFTFGDQVSDAQTWPAALERELGVRVINGGVPAFGIDQAVLRAEILSQAVSPDVIVLSFITGDIRRAVIASRGRADKPFFRVSKDSLTLHNTPVPTPEESLGGLRGVLGYSHLVDAVMRATRRRYWLEGNERLTKEDPLAIACLLMERLRDLGETQSARVLVMAQRSEYNDEPALARHVIACAANAGLLTLNQLPVLGEIFARDPDRITDYFFGHMTPRGNDWVAKSLADELRAQSAFD
jgi:hypothetical protein